MKFYYSLAGFLNYCTCTCLSLWLKAIPTILQDGILMFVQFPYQHFFDKDIGSCTLPASDPGYREQDLSQCR